MTSTFAVGDIHGEAETLERLLTLLRERARSGDRLVFLGDYINRGPDSRKVIELLLAERERWPGPVTPLMGNHEHGLCENLQRRSVGGWQRYVAAFGAVALLRSYGAEDGTLVRLEARLPAAHRRFFLEELRLWHEDEHGLYVHAGIPPGRHPRQCREEELLWAPFSGCGFSKPVVCGHMVQPGGRPPDEPHRLCIDTGCGFGGPLTAVRLPEREFFSAGPLPRG